MAWESSSRTAAAVCCRGTTPVTSLRWWRRFPACLNSVSSFGVSDAKSYDALKHGAAFTTFGSKNLLATFLELITCNLERVLFQLLLLSQTL